MWTSDSVKRLETKIKLVGSVTGVGVIDVTMLDVETWLSIKALRAVRSGSENIIVLLLHPVSVGLVEAGAGDKDEDHSDARRERLAPSELVGFVKVKNEVRGLQ